MAAISMDLRVRVMRQVNDGQRIEDVAERYELHPTTVRRWRRQAAAGQHAPRKGGAPPIPTKLTAGDLALLEREVQQRPGVTLRELVGMVSVAVAESTVCRALKRLGYRYKKSRWSPASG